MVGFVFGYLILGNTGCKAQSMLHLEAAETWSFDQRRMPDVQILQGDVCFRHDSAYLYCDSAYFFDKQNALHAFGHVRLVQGDSLKGFGDELYYDGNTKLGRFRKNVKLIHNDEMTLTTDSMNYDRASNVAYYFSGGTIQDTLNTLTSMYGRYTPDNNQALFSGNVQLMHPKFVLTSDSLCYNTETNQANLVTPTKIVYEKETTIFSSNGWYNTKTEYSELLDRSEIIHADGKRMTGDTIFYDKIAGYGRVIGHMESVDSTNHMTLYGNRGEMWEKDKYGYVTDSALLIEWSDTAMYTYMHADTLFTEQIPYTRCDLVARDSVLVDSVWHHPAPDTIWVDTTYLQVRAYYNVRVYREDVQSVCDSVHYDGRDSIATLCGDPICWHKKNQISADTVHIYLKNETVDYIHGVGNVIAIQREGATEFNQLAGKEMLAYVRNDEVYLVDVQGNAETVFYPREDDGSYLGINRTQSSFVKVYLENQEIHHVVFTTTTTGVMIPMDQASEEERYLNTFFWAEQERPMIPGDVYQHPPRTLRPSASTISASADEEDEEE